MKTECKIAWIIIAIFIFFIGFFIEQLKTDLNLIIELEKCPACYGYSMCKSFKKNEIKLDYSNLVSIFNNFFGVKNIFYAKYKSSQVILKKLAHRYEFENFDNMLCNEFKEFCFDNKKKSPYSNKINFKKLFFSELNNLTIANPTNKLLICPLGNNSQEIFEKFGLNKNKENKDYFAYLWTCIKINPEPFVLEVTCLL